MTTRHLAWAALLLASPASAQSFAAFGDYGSGPNVTAVANLIKSKNPEFIITVGDNCYGSTPISTQVGANYGSYVSSGTFWPSLGNHDYSDTCGGSGNAAKYFAYFTLPGNERYYDFVKGNVHFFAINANDRKEPDRATATSKQGQWLKAKLAASTSPWNIVYFHHPSYSSGEHGSNVRMQWPFQAWGADVVLTGHDHDYERITKNGFPYFVIGLGGAEKRGFGTPVAGSVIRYNALYGALFVNATSTSLSFQFINTAGTVVDTYSMTKGAAKASSDAFGFRVCC